MKKRYIKELFEDLGSILGTRMTSGEFYASSSKNKETTEVNIPLSLLLSDGVAQKVFSKILSRPTVKHSNRFSYLNKLLRDSYKNDSDYNKEVEAINAIKNMSKK